MSQAVEQRIPPTAEEIERITAEYRRASFEKKLPAVMVYVPEYHECPWSDCHTRIAAIDFQFAQWDDADLAERLRKEWWLGPGLVGHCPGCGRLVLYGFQFKRVVPDVAAYASARLPEDWVKRVRLAPRWSPESRPSDAGE